MSILEYAMVKTPEQESALLELVDDAKDYALGNGLGMRLKDVSPDSVTFAPFTLLPSPFPAEEFKNALAVQPVINELIHKVAHDEEFLTNALKSVASVDEFTKKLFDVYENVKKEGIVQPLSLGLLRADYMLDHRRKIKQIEVNTISASFASLSVKVSALHEYVLRRLGHADKANIPKNTALMSMSEGLVKGWKYYGNERAIIVFLVKADEGNILDQKFLEFHIRYYHPRIKVARKTFADFQGCELKADKKLIVNGEEVGLVYYRTGYVPNQYESERDWKMRLLIERSAAVKCPSVQYQLAGCKKIQQVLANPGVLERFLECEKVARVRQLFVGLFPLDSGVGGDELIRNVVSRPEAFVMKPQREGGGCNVYGKDIPKVLEEWKQQDGGREMEAWIMMERIFPPKVENVMVHPGKWHEKCLVVNELGIYGVVLGSEKEIVINENAGHLMRSKECNEDEGGVMVGVSCLDSPYLYTEESESTNIPSPSAKWK